MVKRKTSKDAYEAALEKILTSTLDEKDFELLGFEALSGGEVKNLSSNFNKHQALKINYYDPLDPSKRLKPWPMHPDYYRLRYLPEGESGSMPFTVDKKDGKVKELRYMSLPGGRPVAYFPKILPWKDICADVKQPIIITEGELKAAAGCKAKVATIGLGGVSSYQSKGLGITFLPELESINWLGRHVFIIYDSDYRTNPNVLGAMNDLAMELQRHGAYPSFVGLDPDGEDKVGLDDFLYRNPLIQLEQTIIERAQPLAQAAKLHAFNEQIVYVKTPGLIVETGVFRKIKPSDFVGHQYAHLDHATLIMTNEGSSLQKGTIAQAWISWPYRHECDEMTYKPGGGKFVEKVSKTEPTKKQLNVWSGWGCKPVEGDVSPFLELVDHLFNGEEAAKEWFLDWLAYPIQYPGTKLFTSVLLHGTRHGTGKSLVGYTMREIYGKNFAEIRQSDLHANFNEWAEARQFVMGDDVTGSDKRSDNDLLKTMITQRELRVNMKYMPSYVVPDCINYLFNSNHPDAFFLEDDDRRFFIHEVRVNPKEEMFYVDYMLWLETGGAESLFDWILKRDLSRFNPSAPAYVTNSKKQMISGGKSDLGDWCRKLVDHPDEMLVVGGVELPYDLYTAKDLLNLYDPEKLTKVTMSGLARELRRCNLRYAANGKNIMHSRNKLDKYFIVRGLGTWENASIDQIRAHIDVNFVPDAQEIVSKGKRKY